ncbi:MAG: hypothetical protein ACLFV6_08025 [Spirulinaceae cyanobacterium]
MTLTANFGQDKRNKKSDRAPSTRLHHPQKIKIRKTLFSPQKAKYHTFLPQEDDKIEITIDL